MEATRARAEGRGGGARHQAHAARVHHARLRARAAGVPDASTRRSTRRPANWSSRSTFTSGSRPTRRTGSSCRSSATPTARTSSSSRATGGAERKGARRQADGRPTCRAACFTISSLGGIGGTAFTPIINAPEVAILGVSRSAQQPVYAGRRVRAAADAAAVAVVRPPRDRRRDGRALHELPRPGARRRAGPAAGDPERGRSVA